MNVLWDQSVIAIVLRSLRLRARFLRTRTYNYLHKITQLLLTQFWNVKTKIVIEILNIVFENSHWIFLWNFYSRNIFISSHATSKCRHWRFVCSLSWWKDVSALLNFLKRYLKRTPISCSTNPGFVSNLIFKIDFETFKFS